MWTMSHELIASGDLVAMLTLYMLISSLLLLWLYVSAPLQSCTRVRMVRSVGITRTWLAARCSENRG